MACAKFLFCLCVILLHFDLAFSRSLTPEQIEKLESFTEAVTECRHNVGMTMALVREGETVYTNGFGYRDNDNQLPMTADTRIGIWSISKSMTAILISRLVEEGLLTWDTPLQDILGPEFELEDELVTQSTLRDCFAHRIRMLNYWGLATAALNFTREELCMRRLRYFRCPSSFRDRASYANYPAVLVGYVMEVLTGKTWEEQIIEYLFEPLGMTTTRTAGNITEEDWENTAYSHLYVEGEFVRVPDPDQIIFVAELGPSAGVFSTANDMAKYLKFLLSEGQNEAGEQVVPPEVLRNMHDDMMYITAESPLVAKPRFPVDDVRQAVAGLWTGMYRGYEKIYHTGSGSAYNCRISTLPEMSLGVWSCCNSPSGGDGIDANHMINAFALDLLLDEEPWLNDTTGCTFPDPWSSYIERDDWLPDYEIKPLSSIDAQPRRPLVEYEGIYVHLGFDTFTVYINETTDTLYYTHGRLLNGELLPKEERDDFNMMLHHPLTYQHWLSRSNIDGFPLSFGVDGDDTIISVTVNYLETGTPPTFEKEN